MVHQRLSQTSRKSQSGGSTYKEKDEDSRLYRLFGFRQSDFTSWNSFVKLMSRPCDPSNLAVYRILFGLLMVLDIPQERGLANADYKWGDEEECRFPLFNFLKVLPIQYMYMVYLAMLLGALGIMLGFLFRLSCVVFLVPYWYIFLLDKMSWNNHSYLYGLIGGLLLISDANRYWSIDGLLWPKIKNAHVPLWNYCLLRTQIFLVYFIAGLKKLDYDWTHGYSMSELSTHWVFLPFTYLLTNDQIDLFIVHWGGLIIDLFVGYMLFFDFTRPIGLLFVTSFHCMNSQIFSIGMFPYAMTASDNLFLSFNWFKWLLSKLPKFITNCTLVPTLEEAQESSHCIYTKEEIKPENKSEKSCHYRNTTAPPSRGTWYHHMFSAWAIIYIAFQAFLPYSHFITKGYNNWTNGLYGYSWDMMVHSWSTQHVRITFIDKDTSTIGYLNPEAWSRSRKRWSSHADMLKQYTNCIAHRLREHNITNVEIYFDIWRSLNDRFQQRMFDPNVDMLTAEWHPFYETPWLMPLLTELSDWRIKLDEIEKQIYNTTNGTDVVFIADFPGLTLENYIQEDLGNTTLELLQGEVRVEFLDNNHGNVTLKPGERVKIPPGEYHNVHTVSKTPSCYMYIFTNTTEQKLAVNLTSYKILRAVKDTQNGTDEQNSEPVKSHSDRILEEIDPQVKQAYENMILKQKEIDVKHNRTAWERVVKFINDKIDIFQRSAKMTKIAFQSIITGRKFDEVFNATIWRENDLDTVVD